MQESLWKCSLSTNIKLHVCILSARCTKIHQDSTAHRGAVEIIKARTKE